MLFTFALPRDIEASGPKAVVRHFSPFPVRGETRRKDQRVGAAVQAQKTPYRGQHRPRRAEALVAHRFLGPGVEAAAEDLVNRAQLPLEGLRSRGFQHAQPLLGIAVAKQGAGNPAVQEGPDSAVVVVQWRKMLAFTGDAAHPPVGEQGGADHPAQARADVLLLPHIKGERHAVPGRGFLDMVTLRAEGVGVEVARAIPESAVEALFSPLPGRRNRRHLASIQASFPLFHQGARHKLHRPGRLDPDPADVDIGLDAPGELAVFQRPKPGGGVVHQTVPVLVRGQAPVPPFQHAGPGLPQKLQIPRAAHQVAHGEDVIGGRVAVDVAVVVVTPPVHVLDRLGDLVGHLAVLPLEGTHESEHVTGDVVSTERIQAQGVDVGVAAKIPAEAGAPAGAGAREPRHKPRAVEGRAVNDQVVVGDFGPLERQVQLVVRRVDAHGAFQQLRIVLVRPLVHAPGVRKQGIVDSLRLLPFPISARHRHGDELFRNSLGVFNRDHKFAGAVGEHVGGGVAQTLPQGTAENAPGLLRRGTDHIGPGLLVPVGPLAANPRRPHGLEHGLEADHDLQRLCALHLQQHQGSGLVDGGHEVRLDREGLIDIGQRRHRRTHRHVPHQLLPPQGPRALAEQKGKLSVAEELHRPGPGFETAALLAQHGKAASHLVEGIAALGWPLEVDAAALELEALHHSLRRG